MRRLAPALALACLLVAAPAGCRSDDGHQASASTVRLSWHQVALPATTGRPVARDLLRCGGKWYLVGAVTAGSGFHPAAWSSVDGRAWSPVPLAPVSYYGPHHVLYAAGCRAGRLAALGAAPGGAHGNPRTASWYQRPDGTLAEVQAAFELYGGPDAISVARLAGTTATAAPAGPSGAAGPTGQAGPGDWVIAGSWAAASGRAGAAAWWSTATDPPDFQRTADDPALASASDEQTSAVDVTAGSQGYVMVGSDLRFGRATGKGTTTVPLAWSSPDGRHWTRDHIDAGKDGGTLERITLAGGTFYAIGRRGNEIGIWRRTSPSVPSAPSAPSGPAPSGTVGGAGAWVSAGAIGADPGESTAPVQSLTADGGAMAATIVDGGTIGLWLAGSTAARSGTAGWARVGLPTTVSSGDDDHRLLVAGAGGQLVLAADDGAGARLWIASR